MSKSRSSSRSSSPPRRRTSDKQTNNEEDELDIYDEYINLTTDKEPNDYDEIYLKDLSDRTDNNTSKDTTSALYSDYEPPTAKYPISGDTHSSGHMIAGAHPRHPNLHAHHLPNSDMMYSDDYGRAGSDSESGSGDRSDHPALHLGNLTWWTTDKQLEDILREFGKVKKLRFYEDKTNGKSRGFAFAEYEDPEIANMAFAKLQGREIHGKQLVVTFASSESFEQLNTHNKGRKERREYQKKNQNFRPFNAGNGRGWQPSPQFHPFPDRMPLVPQVPPRPPANFRGRGTFFPVAPRRPIAPPFPPTISAHFNPTFLIHDREHLTAPRDRGARRSRSRSRSRSREDKMSKEKSSRSKAEDTGRSKDDKRTDKRVRDRREDDRDKRLKYSEDDVRDNKRQKYTSNEKEKDKRRNYKSSRERR